MKQRTRFAWAWLGIWIAVTTMICGSLGPAQTRQSHKTQNVILVMIDGMRWQEVFRGADPALLPIPGPKWQGNSEDMTAAAKAHYGKATADERRKALMPFLWSVVESQGQIFGNRDLGSDSHVINGLDFSYPGYSETLTGFADPRIDSNKNLPNPNATVFEWLNAKPEFAGKVAAFGAWAVFNGIFNRERCGFPVNAGYDPFTAIPSTPELNLLNTLKAETVRIWPDEPFDPIPFHTAIEYLKAKHPRLLFIGLGETDEWAHKEDYPPYLDAAHLADEYVRELWELLQSMPQYRGTTTLIVLPDHGRGDGSDWNAHGVNHPGSEQTFMAFLGPDTPALGERRAGTVVTESQIAATVAAFLGQDYHAAVPQSGEAIEDVLGK
jgi:Type I phosphodiesterase / nucleotide pyrophosphatase